jgi:hypothetical protein
MRGGKFGLNSHCTLLVGEFLIMCMLTEVYSAINTIHNSAAVTKFQKHPSCHSDVTVICGTYDSDSFFPVLGTFLISDFLLL